MAPYDQRFQLHPKYLKENRKYLWFYVLAHGLDSCFYLPIFHPPFLFIGKNAAPLLFVYFLKVVKRVHLQAIVKVTPTFCTYV